MFVKLVCLVVVFTSQYALSQDDSPYPIIGGIFYEDEAEALKAALEIGATEFHFTTSIKEVKERGDFIRVSELVCELASEGVIGIIDGLGGRVSENVQALCDMLELPHVLVQQNDLDAKDWSVINMFPSGEAFNMVLESLITIKEWTNFTILYVKGHSLSRVNHVMMMGNDTDQMTISVRELTGDDYRDVLLDAKDNGYLNFVVDCPSEYLELLLTHAQEVDLMSDDCSYIFVSPDLFTLDLSRFRYGGVNITGLRFPELTILNEKLWAFVDAFNNMTAVPVDAAELKIKALLVYDAVNVFYAGVKTLNESEKRANSVFGDKLDCENYDTWSMGATLLNFMKTNKLETGLTRSLLFDGTGQRNDIIIDILELTPAGNQTIGTWKYNTTRINRPFVPTMDEYGEENIMRNKSFKVLIALTEPYAYVKESETELEGNDRYEGFAIDLIARLADMLDFGYEFEEEADYGSLSNGKWSGMVQKIREDRADFAICDLTITKERKEGIDFSTPFMTLGIGILYKEPSKQPPEMFSFMAVFSREVWLYMMFVQMGVATVMIFVGRISHKEWQNPVPCVEQPEELTNQFSFHNSVWLIIGSVMQQGSEIAPIITYLTVIVGRKTGDTLVWVLWVVPGVNSVALVFIVHGNFYFKISALGPRIITSVWWFFTMVIVASYVGTLVAFLTVEKDVQPFQNIEELYNSKSISYGAKKKGSTMKFFETATKPTLQNMHKRMLERGWTVAKNDEGVARAETQNYAFFSESTAIEYYTERNCDLMQIGELLDSKGYGIGMKINSIYKKYIDDALLKLKERGEIQKIKDLWWKEMRGGGKCGEKQAAEQSQLEMKNVIGAFVVLGAGCLFGLIASILDMLWGVFKRSVKYNTTYKYELVQELKFALKFSGDVKPVKRPPKIDKSSSEALADVKETEEAKDEVGSLLSARTLRSGKSTSTHASSHSHSSRHTSQSLSIAFAKRRKYS